MAFFSLSDRSELACDIALQAVKTVCLETQGRKEIDIKRYAKVEKVSGPNKNSVVPIFVSGLQISGILFGLCTDSWGNHRRLGGAKGSNSQQGCHSSSYASPHWEPTNCPP